MDNQRDEYRLPAKSINLRTAIFYINFLREKGLMGHLTLRIRNDLNRCISIINKQIENNKDPKALINEMESAYQERILPEYYFNWMKSDRACYFSWGFIREIKTKDYMIGHQFPHSTEFIYDDLDLDKNPSSSEERYNLIITFFDLMTDTFENKKRILEAMKNKWNEIFSNPKPFNWLKETDEQQCEWAWEYIKKHINTTRLIQPTNNKEKYLSIYCSFDLWQENEYRKKIFLININKAHSQRKFRDSIKNKKALNTFIDKKSKEKLEFLAKYKDRKINELIEHLINKEFEMVTQKK